MARTDRVVVVGAGAFGGWSALTLLRRGARVTLVDAWGPGHPRSSSGGETRIIRATYGPRRIYTCLAARAHRLWREEDARWQHGCLRAAGAIWMSGANDAYARESAAALTDEGLASELLDSTEASRRWSQIDFSGITSVLFEPDAGFLFARRACQKVVEQFQREGGDYRVAKMPEPDVGGSLEADAIVYACGPWLPEMFPDVLGERIVPTRQPVHYFGTPAGDASFESPALPIWLELGERIMYGIPGDDQRGFKIADDTSGARVDPTTMSRTISEADLSDVRAYLARRFPGLADAPWIGGEVCQYESTPDAHFILDTHPHDASIWLVGGGSGHGFKMGPAIGEVVADAVLGRTAPDPTFSLTRFATQQIGTDAKWASSDSLRTK